MILLIDAVGMRWSAFLSSSTAPVWKSMTTALRAEVVESRPLGRGRCREPRQDEGGDQE